MTKDSPFDHPRAIAGGHRSWRAAVASGSLFVLLVSADAALAEPRAAGGRRLIESMRSAPATVVADVDDVRVLDNRARLASLRVETVLRGPAKPGFAKGADGDGLRVAFEERAPMRADRFTPGDRILVVLEPLPGASIWRERLPDPAERSATLFVAASGEAFLRRPALGSVRILEHFLALPTDEQLGAAGVPHLAALAAGAASPLAIDAVQTLGRIPRLDSLLDDVSSARLVAALLRPEASTGLSDSVLELLEQQQLEQLRKPLLEQIDHARRSGQVEDAPALVYAALARLDGALEHGDREALARSGSVTHRLAWIRSATEPGDATRLEQWLRRDPSPEVRAAAVSRLVAIEGERAEPGLLDALHDEATAVREAAAIGLAKIGPSSVPALVELLDSAAPRSGEASLGAPTPATTVAAIRALSLIRPEGAAALVDIASNHPDSSVRAAARLATGGTFAEPH